MKAPPLPSGLALLVLPLLAGCATPPPPPAAHVSPQPTDPALVAARALTRSSLDDPRLDQLVRRVNASSPSDLNALLDQGAQAPPLRAGDRLAVEVVGHEDLGGELLVEPDGKAKLPALGKVVAEGHSVAAFEAWLSEELRERVLKEEPAVRVRLLERARYSVTVLGRVSAHERGADEQRHRSVVQLPLDRPLSVNELLAELQGLSSDADVEGLILVRGAQQSALTPEAKCFRFSASELANANLSGRQAWLQAGDLLVVPQLPRIHVVGHVTRPGIYVVKRSDNVASLIQAAGGRQADAHPASAILVSEQGERSVDLSERPGPGEVLFLPAVARVYVVGGGAARNGPIDLPAQGFDAVQALAEVGWFTDFGDRDGVQILRRRGSKTIRIPVPVQAILEGEREVSRYQLEPGDTLFVPEASW